MSITHYLINFNINTEALEVISNSITKIHHQFSFLNLPLTTKVNVRITSCKPKGRCCKRSKIIAIEIITPNQNPRTQVSDLSMFMAYDFGLPQSVQKIKLKALRIAPIFTVKSL